MNIYLFSFALFHFYILMLLILIVIVILPKFARIRKKSSIFLAILLIGGVLFFVPIFFLDTYVASLSGPNGRTVWEDGYQELKNVAVQEIKNRESVNVSITPINYYADRYINYKLYNISDKPSPNISAYEPLELKGYFAVDAGYNIKPLQIEGKKCCIQVFKDNSKKNHFLLKWEEKMVSEDIPSQYYSQELILSDNLQYDDIHIVFLEGHRVELRIRSNKEDHSLSYDDPLTACLSRHNKAFCYKNLPHYVNNDDNIAKQNRIRCRVLQNMKEKNNKYYDSWTYQDCLNWQKECLSQNWKWNVSNKRMCEINWRSPEYGE